MQPFHLISVDIYNRSSSRLKTINLYKKKVILVMIQNYLPNNCSWLTALVSCHVRNISFEIQEQYKELSKKT